MPPAAQLALYGALLSGFFLTAMWRPSVAVAAVLCIYGLKQWGQTSSSWLAAHGVFTNFAVGFVVLTALFARWCRGKCVVCNVRQSTWAIFALYAYALFSLLWTPRPYLALDMWQLDYPYIITAIFLAPLAVEDSQDLHTSYYALMLMGGVLVIALLLLAKWGDRGVMVNGQSELETNPLAIANLGGAVASAALFLHTRRLPILTWIIRLVLVAAALAVIVKSGSRGQLVATLLTILLMLPVAFPLSRVRGLVPVCIALAVIAGAAQYAAQNYIRRDDDRWSSFDASGAASQRWQMCMALLEHWQESPGSVLFGLGNSASFDPNVVGSYPHDVPVETLCEEGAIGFGIYLGIYWLALRGMLQGLRQTQGDAGSRRLLAVAGANFIFTAITSFKEGNMADSAEFFMSAILLARMPELLARHHSLPKPAANEAAATAPRFANLMR